MVMNETHSANHPEDTPFDPGIMDSNQNFVHEEKSHELGSWDQFKGNEHLIRSASTYDESLYTTAIPQNIPHDWMRRAHALEKDIETPDMGHVHDRTEEEIHCSVQRDIDKSNNVDFEGADSISHNQLSTFSKAAKMTDECSNVNSDGTDSTSLSQLSTSSKAVKTTDEGPNVNFEGTDATSPSQLRKSNKAVKARFLRHLRNSEHSKNCYESESSTATFPDLTPTDLISHFSVSSSPKRRKNKKCSKRSTTSQTSFNQSGSESTVATESSLNRHHHKTAASHRK